MAQPNHDLTAGTAGDVLGAYLRAQATAFLRALRLHDESGAHGSDSAEGTEAGRRRRGGPPRRSGARAP
ncbi:metal-binding protein, partial [Streptomyces goshikiensis]